MKIFLFLWLLTGSGVMPLFTARAAPGVEEVTAAAAGTDTAALVALLERGGPLDERNARHWTPLICAVEAGRTDAVRVLLARHADVNKTTAVNCCALDFAVANNRLDIIPLLLDAGADINRFRTQTDAQRSRSALFVAVDDRRLEAAALLLDHGARVNDMNDEHISPLMEASRMAFPEMVRLLLERGADVNAHRKEGQNSLIFAAYNGREETVRLLLAHGADLHATATDYPGGPPYGPLEVATEQGRPYVLEVLAEVGAKPAQPKNGLNDELDAALQFDDYERAQAALAKGASATEPDSHGIIPIIVPILKGNPTIVRMLIKAGADVNVMPDNDSRQTPLATAQSRIGDAKNQADKARFEQVADILRKAGAAR